MSCPTCGAPCTVCGETWRDRAALVSKQLGESWEVESQVAGLTITPVVERMYGHAEMTFDMMRQISMICGNTKNINVKYDGGWGGSDVTPGDPASMRIEVRA